MSRPSTKRSEIIDVATRLFAQKGVKATTIRDIAAAVGVTEGALYRHFTGKDELARYVFAGGAELLYEHLSHAVEGLTAATERLAGLVGAFCGFAEEHPEVFGYVMAQHLGATGEPPPTNRVPKSLFVATIAAGIYRGELREIDPELGAALVIGMCVQSIFFLQRGMVRVSPEQVKREVCRAALQIFVL